MWWAEDIKWVRWQVWAKFALTTEPVFPDQDLDSFMMAEYSDPSHLWKLPPFNSLLRKFRC